jgi:hypothetical protein
MLTKCDNSVEKIATFNVVITSNLIFMTWGILLVQPPSYRDDPV